MGKEPEQNYITLKEASKISGYSADYIGQLIRRGKLEGKQVYNNVAWVTTKEAIDNYLSSNQTSNQPSSTLATSGLWHQGLKFLYDKKNERWLKGAFYLTIFVLSAFVLVLLYILAVSFDERIEQKAREKQFLIEQELRLQE